MEWFTGFRWPVPRAFAAAVSACRFEQGDVLYDNAVAYSARLVEGEGASLATWGEIAALLRYAVQVTDPPRSARNAKAAGNRFDANWVSPVGLELYDYGTGRATRVRTKQGRLFTSLWRGELQWLADDDGASDPTPPATARELHAQLADALEDLRRARAEDAGREAALLYACVVDESSEASLAKLRAIASALSARFRLDRVDLSPEQCGLGAEFAFHPALRICACGIGTSDEQAVRGVLKAVLYSPTRGAVDDPALDALDPGATSDRFRLERHGLLVKA